MKKFTLKVAGHTYNLEFEDKFYDYIVDELELINKSNTQIKDIVQLLLSKSYNSYQNDKKLKKILKKFEF